MDLELVAARVGLNVAGGWQEGLRAKEDIGLVSVQGLSMKAWKIIFDSCRSIQTSNSETSQALLC